MIKGLTYFRTSFGQCQEECYLGIMSIAHIWLPDGRAKRDNYMVRLLFNQKRGSCDFTADRHFDKYSKATDYIEQEFEKFIREHLLINN